MAAVLPLHTRRGSAAHATALRLDVGWLKSVANFLGLCSQAFLLYFHYHYIKNTGHGPHASYFISAPLSVFLQFVAVCMGDTDTWRVALLKMVFFSGCDLVSFRYLGS